MTGSSVSAPVLGVVEVSLDQASVGGSSITTGSGVCDFSLAFEGCIVGADSGSIVNSPFITG
jgi:hypothetical protein